MWTQICLFKAKLNFESYRSLEGGLYNRSERKRNGTMILHKDPHNYQAFRHIKEPWYKRIHNLVYEPVFPINIHYIMKLLKSKWGLHHLSNKTQVTPHHKHLKLLRIHFPTITHLTCQCVDIETDWIPTWKMCTPSFKTSFMCLRGELHGLDWIPQEHVPYSKGKYPRFLQKASLSKELT